MLLLGGSAALASTYVVYIPLDSPVYDELDTLNGLGVLDTYLSEIKPISRIEAARLTLEAGKNLGISERRNALAQSIVRALRSELSEEVGWLENNAEDDQPTMIQPVQRIEAQYIFSRGEQRFWDGSGELQARRRHSPPAEQRRYSDCNREQRSVAMELVGRSRRFSYHLR